MTSPPPQGKYSPYPHEQQPGLHDHQQVVHHRPAFNQEELRVLRECNRESFYYRCVPLAAALSTAAFIAMRRGILKVNAKFGYTPKILAGVFIGYFGGKLSYQNACAQKLMQLQGSPIGEALRKRKGQLGFQETLGIEAGFSVPESSHDTPSVTTSELYEDHRTDQRDHNEGLVEYERGVAESLSPYMESEDRTSEAPQTYTTYQELRRNNRHEYLSKMADRYRRDKPDQPPEGSTHFGMDDPPMGPPPAYKPPSVAPSSTSTRKNQYGDEVYE